jgi:hypothetical protein
MSSSEAGATTRIQLAACPGEGLRVRYNEILLHT